MSKSVKWLAGLGAAILGIMLLPFAVPVIGQVGGVKAFASGTVVHADLLENGVTKLVDAEVAFSGAAFDSGGLNAPILNEMDRQFAPRLPGKLGFGRGAALEVGLAVSPSTENQAVVAGKAEAATPPVVGPVTKAAGPIDLDPLAYVDLLRGEAAANTAPDRCGLGTDTSRGLAYVADAQLLDAASQTTSTQSSNSSAAPVPVPQSPASEPVEDVVSSVTKPVGGLLSSAKETTEQAVPTANEEPRSAAPARTSSSQAASVPDGVGLENPVLALDADGPPRAVSQSRSRTLFVAQRGRNGQRLGNAFGMMSEVRETIAPVTLFKGTANELTIEFLGEWVLQATAGGVPGTAYIHYGPGTTSPDTPVLRLIDNDGVTKILSLQDLFGNDGFVVNIPNVAEIAIGEPPRAIDGEAGSSPTVTSDGTKASAAVDVVRVRALPGAPVELADLRVGHMEVSTEVPLGGVSCSIPVTKKPSADSVDVGEAFTVTFNITNPYDCTLANVRVEDAITTEDDARFEVLSTEPKASSSSVGSALDAGNITWANIGDIASHQTRTLTARIGARGGAGAIVDIAKASGTLRDCAEPGATVAGVDVGVVGTELQGVSAEVRVPTVATKVAAASSGRLPFTGLNVLFLVAASLVFIAAGSAGLMTANKMQ